MYTYTDRGRNRERKRRFRLLLDRYTPSCCSKINYFNRSMFVIPPYIIYITSPQLCLSIHLSFPLHLWLYLLLVFIWRKSTLGQVSTRTYWNTCTNTSKHVTPAEFHMKIFLSLHIIHTYMNLYNMYMYKFTTSECDG